MDRDCHGDKTESVHQKPSDNSSAILDKNHGLEVFQSFRTNGFLCDVKLETKDGNIVQGHKVVLASASQYFKAIFSSKGECKINYVYLGECDSNALKLLMDYIYTGKINVSEDNVQLLLHAADFLQIHYARYACCVFLKDQLRPTNCLGLKELISQYKCEEFYLSFENFISQHFSEVIKGDEFLSLSYEKLLQLISSDELKVLEEKVYESVIEWINHDDTDYRQQFLPGLMEHIRLPLVSKEYLINKVNKEPLLQNCIKSKNYIIEALIFHVLKNEKSDSIATEKRFQHRSPVETINDLLASDL